MSKSEIDDVRIDARIVKIITGAGTSDCSERARLAAGHQHSPRKLIAADPGRWELPDLGTTRAICRSTGRTVQSLTAIDWPAIAMPSSPSPVAHRHNQRDVDLPGGRPIPHGKTVKASASPAASTAGSAQPVWPNLYACMHLRTKQKLAKMPSRNVIWPCRDPKQWVPYQIKAAAKRSGKKIEDAIATYEAGNPAAKRAAASSLQAGKRPKQEWDKC